MGAEHSRIHATTDRKPHEYESVSWKYLAFGLQYSATDVAVWPQCVPLVLWFTEHDALVLQDRLLRRTRTRFLRLAEFRTWLMPTQSTTGVDSSDLPRLPTDIMTPPSLLLPTSPAKPIESSSFLVLDRYLEHVFATFSRGRETLFAMEFLAAMVIGSRAIWSIDQKCRVLLTLFQDLANTHPSREPIYKEADLTQLFLCVMHGVTKLTVGIQRLWEQHQLDLHALARSFAAKSLRYALTRRPATVAATPRVKVALTMTEVHAYIDATPSIRRFLALFSGEEMRNPFTFGTARSLADGLLVPIANRTALVQQQQTYGSLLAQYVSTEGRMARRRQSAAMLIQSTWRRRYSRQLLEHKRIVQQQHRHASALLLQSFVRQCQFAKVLEQHAEAEVQALNGGVLIAGQGPCVPTPDALTTPMPLRPVEAFKLHNVKIAAIAMSRTCGVAVPSDRQTLFVWGRCLPRVYFESETLTLTQIIPGRLSFRFPSPRRITQLACGLSHALVVTDDGNVYSWGFNDHGQLGHGSATTLEARTNGYVQYQTYYDERDGRTSEFLAEPTPLVYFQGAPLQHAEPIPIATVVCGDYYSMALSQEGDVFTWGEASEGQLGHGDAHARFQVAFVDRYMLNSAYTFLPEPEPVLALSDVQIIQIACKKNHSVALTSDGRVFEWGNWGKRLGHDREHAFAPVEKDGVAPLRLRQLSVGDHHTIAEGSSVWLSMPGRVDGLSAEKRVYMACSPSGSCDQDVIDRDYVGKAWSCLVVECDVDDIETTEPEEVEIIAADDSEGVDESSTDPRLLWTKRVAPFALHEPSDLATYDAKFLHVLNHFRSLSRTFSFDKMLMLWFHGHVRNQLVLMPRGKPSGIYLQILLPHNDVKATEIPPMVEFPVVPSTNTETKVTKTGFATHFFHSVMRERLAKLPRRVRKVMPTEFLEANSLYLLEINEQSFESGSNTEWEELDNSSDRFFTRSATSDGKSVMAWSELVVDTIMSRVLAAQETGALAVVVVLDLLDADSFVLVVPEDSGIYVPVFMVKKTTQATRSPEDHVMTFGEMMDRLVVAQTFEETENDEPPIVPPAWMARCFQRVDQTSVRIDSALANGAAGVILIQDEQSIEVDGETHGAPVFLEHLNLQRSNKLVAMVSHHDGALLRTASRLVPINYAMPFVPSDTPCALMLNDVAVNLQPGGTIYAWGNAQNGRLGLGNPANDDGPLQDGYEALTDSAYRFVDRPTPVVALAGHEMTQLVCGAAHNVAVTTDGRVFTWGKGTHGELATAKTKDQAIREAHDLWVPRRLHHLRYDRIIAAAANDTATALLSELVEADVYLERRKEIAQLRHATTKTVE